MGIWVWCELVCHNCSKTSQGQHTSSNSVPRASLWKIAEAAGWVAGTRSDEVYCSKKCRAEKEG